MAAVNEPLAEAVLALGELVEVHFRRVLIEPRRNHVLGFFHRHAVDVIDLLADGVIAETMRAAGEREVVSGCIDRRTSGAELRRFHRLRQLRHRVAGRGGLLVALTHHYPARIIEHRIAVLVVPTRAHIDDARLAVGVLAQADHLGYGAERVAGIDRLQEATVGVTEIGHGIERDVRDCLAEDDVKHQEVVERRARIAQALRERVRRLHGEARPEQPVIQRDIAGGDGSRRGVADLLAEAEVLEEIAGIGLGHHAFISSRAGEVRQSILHILVPHFASRRQAGSNQTGLRRRSIGAACNLSGVASEIGKSVRPASRADGPWGLHDRPNASTERDGAVWGRDVASAPISGHGEGHPLARPSISASDDHGRPADPKY